MNRPARLDYQHLSFQEKLLSECVAMVKYATSSGLSVPPELMQKLQGIVDEELGNSEDGKDAPLLTENRAADLSEIHGDLSEIVAPATPRAIRLFEDSYSRPGIFMMFGPVGLVRRMLGLGIVFIVALIGLGLSSFVNSASLSKGIFQSSGVELLFNLLFLVSAAGLGAVFANLVQANRFIGTTTFDPKYEASYWIRFVLGLMAGLMLAELIPIDFKGAIDPASGGAATDGAPVVIKPLLAILGGFSASAVYRILSRLVDSIESIVRGDTKDIVAAQEQASKAQHQQQLDQTKLSVASEITKLQQKVGSDAKPEDIKNELEKLAGNLLPKTRGRS